VGQGKNRGKAAQMLLKKKGDGRMTGHIEMMNLAEMAEMDSECPERKVGAVLVHPDGRKYEICNTKARDDSNAHHAEAKIINMMQMVGWWDMRDNILYTTCRPCVRCTEMLLPLGLKAIYYRDEQPEMGHLQRFRDAGVLVDGGWILGRVQESWAERNGKLEL
jgi:tRNA(Arg) A34 adenosine deaminase TadA